MASEYDTLRHWLSEADFPAIVEFAGKHRRTLSFLTALTYEEDGLINWRAVEALGLAASRIADTDPEYVRVHLRRLIWLLNDESGGIGWRAPEVLGEIIHHQPDLFAEFIPIVVNLMDMEPKDAVRFRAGWLWAIGRLAEVRLEAAQEALPWILPCLNDHDSQVRGMAVWCLGQMGYRLPPEVSRSLQSDTGEVELYNNTQKEYITISKLVEKANFSR